MKSYHDKSRKKKVGSSLYEVVMYKDEKIRIEETYDDGVTCVTALSKETFGTLRRAKEFLMQIDRERFYVGQV